jgi:hypothetical protein
MRLARVKQFAGGVGRRCVGGAREEVLSSYCCLWVRVYTTHPGMHVYLWTVPVDVLWSVSFLVEQGELFRLCQL